MLFALRAKSILLAGCMLNKVSASRSESFSGGTYSSSGTYDRAHSFNVEIHSEEYTPSNVRNFLGFLNKEKPALASVNMITDMVTVEDPGYLRSTAAKKVEPKDTITFKTTQFGLEKKRFFRLSMGSHHNGDLNVQMTPASDADAAQFQTWANSRNHQRLEIPVSFHADYDKHTGSGYVCFNANEITSPQLEVHVDPENAKDNSFRHDKGETSSHGTLVFKFSITGWVEDVRQFTIEPMGKLRHLNYLKMISIDFEDGWEWSRSRLLQHLEDVVQARYRQKRFKMQEKPGEQIHYDKNSEELLAEFINEKALVRNSKGFRQAKVNQLGKQIAERGLVPRLLKKMIPQHEACVKQDLVNPDKDSDSDFDHVPELPSLPGK